MRHLFLILSLLIITSCSQGENIKVNPDASDDVIEGETPSIDAEFIRAVQHIEKTVIMPPYANTLSSYSRYYARVSRDGKPFIYGIFLDSTFDKNYSKSEVPNIQGAYQVPSQYDLPLIMDGGCAIVSVYFDVENYALLPMVYIDKSKPADKIFTAICNGYA